jgi:alanine dehydrogenase
MIIGVPKEIKDNESRVAMTPYGVDMLVRDGHTVLIEQNAGVGSSFPDQNYIDHGAQIVPAAEDVFGQADMILKVKEPQLSECEYLRDGQIVFTYLHLAAEEKLTRALMERGVAAIAYETVELDNGALPLLTPMSEVAGRMAVQKAAFYLEKTNGGRGKLLSGVPGVHRAVVTIIGGGTVGINAAKIALGFGAHVNIMDVNIDRLRYLDDVLHGSFETLASNRGNIAEAVAQSDVVIGAVLIPGARAPNLVTHEMIKSMRAGSVVVDVAIDQGGCIETIHPTSHSDPVYMVDDVVHYGVTNMPGAVPRTSTYALTNVTMPYVLKLARHGFVDAVQADPHLALGVNVYQGQITYEAVAEAFDLPHTNLYTLLN